MDAKPGTSSGGGEQAAAASNDERWQKVVAKDLVPLCFIMRVALRSQPKGC